jgi:hypothetical protein
MPAPALASPPPLSSSSRGMTTVSELAVGTYRPACVLAFCGGTRSICATANLLLLLLCCVMLSLLCFAYLLPT